MSIEVTSNGPPAIVYSTPQGVFFVLRGANGAPLGAPVEVTSTPADWVSGAASPNGTGFSVVWDGGQAGLMQQDYDAAGQAQGSPHAIAAPPPAAPLAFTSDAQGESTIIGDGSTITLSVASNGAGGNDLTVRRIDPQGGEGSSFGPFILADAPAGTNIDFARSAPMANGAYVSAYVLDSPNESKIAYDVGHNDGLSWSTGVAVDYLRTNDGSLEHVANLSVAGLPDGGFAIAWTAQRPDGKGYDLEVRDVENGGGTSSYSTVIPDNAPPRILVEQGGSFTVSWTDSAGAHVQTFVEQQPNLSQSNDAVMTPDPHYLMPNGPHTLITTATAAQSATGNGLDNRIVATNDSQQSLNGGAGADTLVAGNSGGVLTGGAGPDVFVFNAIPNPAAEVTDFTPGVDKLDLRQLLAQAHYSGTDPIGDGYLKPVDDGQGGTFLYFDPTPATDPWGDYVAKLDHVAAGSITDSDLVGYSSASPPPPSPPPVSPPPSSGGEVLQGQSGGSYLQGGAGDDTLVGGSGPDTMTGAGGADHFAWNALPWSAGEITDFTPGADKMDVSQLLAASHYSGTDPIGDGYVKLLDDGHGDTWLYYDTDGHGTADQWGTFIATLQHVAPGQVTDADLITGGATSPPPTSPPPVSPPPPSGETLQAQPGGSNLQGGPGDDTLIGANGPDTMTGAGGADHFVFSQPPWQAGQFTDFTAGVDKIDVSALLSQAGYSGSNPVADGYVKLVDDAHGDTWLYFDANPSSDPYGTFVATIEHVSPSGLSASDFIFH